MSARTIPKNATCACGKTCTCTDDAKEAEKAQEREREEQERKVLKQLEEILQFIANKQTYAVNRDKKIKSDIKRINRINSIKKKICSDIIISNIEYFENFLKYKNNQYYNDDLNNLKNLREKICHTTINNFKELQTLLDNFYNTFNTIKEKLKKQRGGGKKTRKVGMDPLKKLMALNPFVLQMTGKNVKSCTCKTGGKSNKSKKTKKRSKRTRRTRKK